MDKLPRTSGALSECSRLQASIFCSGWPCLNFATNWSIHSFGTALVRSVVTRSHKVHKVIYLTVNSKIKNFFLFSQWILRIFLWMGKCLRVKLNQKTSECLDRRSLPVVSALKSSPKVTISHSGSWEKNHVNFRCDFLVSTSSSFMSDTGILLPMSVQDRYVIYRSEIQDGKR